MCELQKHKNNYFDLLPEDLQNKILHMKDKINALEGFIKAIHKQKLKLGLQEIVYYGNTNRSYFFNYDYRWCYPDCRYDDFEDLYYENGKSVDGFSDTFLYMEKDIIELKKRYHNEVIKDFFNPDLLTYDREEALIIERIRIFLFLIS